MKSPILFDAADVGERPGVVPLSRVTVGTVVKVLVHGADVIGQLQRQLIRHLEAGGHPYAPPDDDSTLPPLKAGPIPVRVRVVRRLTVKNDSAQESSTPAFYSVAYEGEVIEDDVFGEHGLNAGDRIAFLRSNIAEVVA